MKPKFRCWDTKENWYVHDNMFIALDGTLYDDSDDKYDTPNKEIERAKPDRFIVEQYVECIDAYVGDMLFFAEENDSGFLCTGYGEVKFNKERGRIMIFSSTYDYDDWYEVDDFDFDEIIGNVHEVTGKEA